MKNKCFLLLIAVCLISCQTATSTPLNISTPSSSPIVELESSSTQLPSQTVEHTQTQVVIQTQTQTPSATSALVPTKDIKIAPTSTPDTWPLPYSPDGTLLARIYSPYSNPDYDRETLVIQNYQGETLWEVPTDYEYPFNENAPFLSIYRWSKDGRYLYFYYEVSCCDGGDYLWQGLGLHLIDVQTGFVQRATFEAGVISFSLSDDGYLLAYASSDYTPRKIFVRNLLLGDEFGIEIPFTSEGIWQIGDIVWSPDNQGLVFLAYDVDVPSDGYKAFYLDVQEKEITWLFDNDDFLGLRLLEWTSDEKLRYSAYDNEPEFPVFEFAIKTGKSKNLGTPSP